MTMRRLIHQPGATQRAATKPSHVRLGPRFVDENQAFRIETSLLDLPPGSLLRYIGTVLFGRLDDFFFKVSLSFRSAVQSVWRDSSVFSSSFNSCNVMSGRSAMMRSIASRWTAQRGTRRRVVAGATLPCSRRTCFTRRTHDSLQPNLSATARVPSPASHAANTSRRISFE